MRIAKFPVLQFIGRKDSVKTYLVPIKSLPSNIFKSKMVFKDEMKFSILAVQMEKYLDWKEIVKDEEEVKRFTDLQGYFEKIKNEDLVYEEIWDYVDYAEPKHKGLMKIFIRKYLEPYAASLSQKPEYSGPKPDQTTSLYRMGSLLGSRVVLPANMDFLGKITIKDVVDMDCNEPAIKLIDLSENLLSDSDLVFVVELIQKLSTGGKLHNTTLNLASNKIYGKDEPLQGFVRSTLNSIVQIEQIQFVVVVLNPFSTVWNQDFFQSIGVDQQVSSTKAILADKKILDKLIWINKWDLFSSGWTKSMAHPNMVTDIKIAHLRYYQPDCLFDACDGNLYYALKTITVVFADIPTCYICDNKVNNPPPVGRVHLVKFGDASFVTHTVDNMAACYSIRCWENGL